MFASCSARAMIRRAARALDVVTLNSPTTPAASTTAAGHLARVPAAASPHSPTSTGARHLHWVGHTRNTGGSRPSTRQTGPPQIEAQRSTGGDSQPYNRPDTPACPDCAKPREAIHHCNTMRPLLLRKRGSTPPMPASSPMPALRSSLLDPRVSARPPEQSPPQSVNGSLLRVDLFKFEGSTSPRSDTGAVRGRHRRRDLDFSAAARPSACRLCLAKSASRLDSSASAHAAPPRPANPPLAQPANQLAPRSEAGSPPPAGPAASSSNRLH